MDFYIAESSFFHTQSSNNRKKIRKHKIKGICYLLEEEKDIEGLT